jgi:hypothetical protein
MRRWVDIAPTAITPYIEINNGPWQVTNRATVCPGGAVNLGPQSVSHGTWS